MLVFLWLVLCCLFWVKGLFDCFECLFGCVACWLRMLIVLIVLFMLYYDYCLLFVFTTWCCFWFGCNCGVCIIVFCCFVWSLLTRLFDLFMSGLVVYYCGFDCWWLLFGLFDLLGFGLSLLVVIDYLLLCIVSGFSCCVDCLILVGEVWWCWFLIWLVLVLVSCCRYCWLVVIYTGVWFVLLCLFGWFVCLMLFRVYWFMLLVWFDSCLGTCCLLRDFVILFGVFGVWCYWLCYYFVSGLGFRVVLMLIALFILARWVL